VRRVLPLLALASLALAPVPPPKPRAKAASLDGVWRYEAQTIGGWPLDRASRDEIWVEIKGGTFFRCATGGLRQGSRLTLDATRKPMEFTLQFTHPLTGKVSESKGIYRLDGDRLTLCYDNSGKTRPTRFESPEGRDEVALSVLKRSKK
jgi:uncharacterized protein (TIGR03067 family)